jgi:type VI protein secretion system component VasF
LTEEDAVFIDRRRSLAKRSLVVGIILLAAIIGVAVFLFVSSPLLINPRETASLLEAERVPPQTMAEMAAKLPVVFLVCCGLLVAMVLFQLASAANERRLLKIMDALVERDARGSGDRHE